MSPAPRTGAIAASSASVTARDGGGPDPDRHARRGARGAWDPRSWPWWAQAAGVFLLGRAVSAVVLVVVAQFQVAAYWVAARPSYLEFTGLMWDASWYRQIAEGGYPEELPRGADGLVQQNAWAFFPLFPVLVRGVMVVTRAPWHVAAPLLALALGTLAAVVIVRLVERGAPRAVAARPGLPLATVALVAAFPTSVVLQVGYTESLALLLIAVTLLLVVERRYAWASLAVLALGFTRAVALPVAAVVVVHALVRWNASRQGRDALGRREVAGIGLLAGTAALSGVAWPLICGWATGEADGYLQTQASWRAVRDIEPFGAWGYVSQYWFGDRGWLVVVAALVLTVALLVAPAAWRLGNELHTWAAAYVIYLAAAIEPGTSLARFLLLAFPMAAVTAGLVTRTPLRRRAWLTFVILVMLALQVVWVYEIWRLTPPTGWPP